jgi:hypothetical protein
MICSSSDGPATGGVADPVNAPASIVPITTPKHIVREIGAFIDLLLPVYLLCEGFACDGDTNTMTTRTLWRQGRSCHNNAHVDAVSGGNTWDDLLSVNYHISGY